MDLSTITNLLSWSTGTHHDYGYTDYRKYTTLFRGGCETVYSKLPDLRSTPDSLSKLRTYSWDYKEWIIGTAVIGVTFLAIKYFRGRFQSPNVAMRTSLGCARLSIGCEPEKVPPPNVTMTFCVDTSGSMQGDRENAVKDGVNNVLRSIERVMGKEKDAKFEIAVVGFNSNAKTICKATKIGSAIIQDIRNSVGQYASQGGTSILKGLDAATGMLEGMARNNKQGTHTLVLLTDGDDGVDAAKLQAIHARLRAANARLFAVGIGNAHNKKTLQKIASNGGTYIDTTLKGQTIVGTISRIYAGTVAVFSNLALRCPQLRSEDWTVENSTRVLEKNRLGYLSKPHPNMELQIKIDGENLQAPVDLRKVTFVLSFKDPKGRNGRVYLPWKPNTIVDPEIVSQI